jgi:hypothetical protein
MTWKGFGRKCPCHKEESSWDLSVRNEENQKNAYSGCAVL